MKKLTTKLIMALSLTGILAISAECAEVNLGVCMGCHGKTFEKSALGKSKIVADMNVSAISTALLGYKDGTYGGPMKGVMKGQVAKYSNDELNKCAQTILDLKTK